MFGGGQVCEFWAAGDAGVEGGADDEAAGVLLEDGGGCECGVGGWAESLLGTNCVYVGV